MPVYLIILIIILLVTIFIRYKYGIRIYNSRKEGFQVTLHFFVFGLLLDYFGIYNSYWIFSGNGLIGMRIYGLPIEEFLLYLIIPYSVLIVYKFYTRKSK
ncbi:MAG: hypothetical protein Q7K54_03000 [Candidatus Parcubacteria bacterium]|nr:hypothetical protein [Candidatus Parcubacteria bacterium]